MMGGTLPLLASWLQRFYEDAGRRSARFYSVNSLGAVLGAALAGFFLVQTYGIVATLRIAATVNLLVGVTAMLLSRYVLAQKPPDAGSGPAPAIGPEAAAPGTLRWAGLIVATTGAVSMGFEVLASRSLAMIFGSSLQSFAVVLISFILGIGLGAAWIASPGRRSRSSERMIIVLLCLAAAWVTLLVFNIEQWVNFYILARTGLARTATGYVYNQLLTVFISLVVLGLPAAWIGAVLPLMIRAVSHEDSPLGAKVGLLLTWNTLGAVVGVLLTGFVVMPWVGLRDAFGVLALVLGLGALIMALRRLRPIGIAGTLAVCLFTGSLFVFSNTNWQYVISSGVFRIWEKQYDPNLMAWRKKHIKIVFYKDGADATVSVERVDGLAAPPELGLRTNGKPEAGTALDLCTQMLVSDLPMLSKPEAKDVFVLGLASGMTAGTVLAFPIDRLDVAENCDPVIEASKLFDHWNDQVLSDPRTRLWRADARTVLKLREQKYDVIITEPSNPWFVATGSVFSKQYYELAASRLKPGGIMAQWFQIYETKGDIVKLVLRTFSSVFPYVEVWDTAAGDIVMLGSNEPWPTGPAVFSKGFAIPRVRTDLEMIDLHTPEAVMARQLASQQTGFAIAGPGPIQSDLFPILEYEAPRAFYLSEGTQVLDPFDERTEQQLLAPGRKARSPSVAAAVGRANDLQRFFDGERRIERGLVRQSGGCKCPLRFPDAAGVTAAECGPDGPGPGDACLQPGRLAGGRAMGRHGLETTAGQRDGRLPFTRHRPGGKDAGAGGQTWSRPKLHVVKRRFRGRPKAGRRRNKGRLLDAIRRRQQGVQSDRELRGFQPVGQQIQFDGGETDTGPAGERELVRGGFGDMSTLCN